MNILHIDCSPRPESHSRQLSAAIVKKLLEIVPNARISRRDFASTLYPTRHPIMQLPYRHQALWRLR